MGVAEENQEVSEVMRQCPLFPMGDVDYEIGGEGWTVRTNSNAPKSLIKNLIAAKLTHFLGNRSIDNVLKTYLKDHPYHLHDGNRVDFRVGNCLKLSQKYSDSLLEQVYDLKPKSFGQFISEWTLVRVPFSVEIALHIANRGALFEAIAVARSIVERLALSIVVDNLSDQTEILNTSSTKSISDMKIHIPSAGRFYGWLSDYAHWEPSAHVHAMKHSNDGKTYHLLATSSFKARALMVLLVLDKLHHAVLVKTIGTRISKTKWQELYKDQGLSLDVKRNNLAADLLSCGAEDSDLITLRNFLSDIEA